MPLSRHKSEKGNRSLRVGGKGNYGMAGFFGWEYLNLWIHDKVIICLYQSYLSRPANSFKEKSVLCYVTLCVFDSYMCYCVYMNVCGVCLDTKVND